MNEILEICKRAKAACGELLKLDSRAKFRIQKFLAKVKIKFKFLLSNQPKCLLKPL
ncbi:hypothetical protein VBZ67_02930 [Campylobacter concisus]